MLTNAPVTTILPVADMARATSFYRDRLGLEDLGDSPSGNHVLRTTAGATIELMAAEPGAQSAHTAATFGVGDVAAEVAELESRGVTFEDYDLPELKTVGHIASVGNDRAAWFTDSEGNILCLHQLER